MPQRYFKKKCRSLRFNNVTVTSLMPLIDNYGNKVNATGASFTMESVNASKINWDNLDYNNLDDVAANVFIHTALGE